jgi:hypothetical protein
MPSQLLPEAFVPAFPLWGRLRAPAFNDDYFRRVICVRLTIDRRLPVYPEHRTYQCTAVSDVMCHKPTSLERPETNTLSVGAHPRDGESVEAKGMPKVK